jgi:hypothetical protein
MNMSNGNSRLTWPEGKRFAFTIVDDTDKSAVENVRPVYDFLCDLGFRITKTVWPLKPLNKVEQSGQSLDDKNYRDWVLSIKHQGFEIALHGIADESSPRPRIIEGLERFQQIIGYPPRIHSNHTGQAEGIYWGEDRFDGPVKLIYRLARRHLLNGETQFYGHREDSIYFWGDLCQNTIKFVRNFVFNDINTLKMDPIMPYHDPRRPYVPYWFSSSVAAEINCFCNLISEANQDRLLEEGGACIAYAHLGARFYKDGELNPKFVALMRRMANLGGWFVPASTLLEYIGEHRGWQDLSHDRRLLPPMQWRWLQQKVRRGAL